MLTGVFLGLAILYACLCAGLYLFQRSLIYFPPLDSGGSDRPQMALKTSAGDVLVTAVPKDGPGALLYFGGNAEDVRLSVPELERAFPDRALYLLHYRGYGGSAGSPSEDALFADAQELFRQVHAVHPRVMVMGRSLGSGVAVHLAGLNDVERLVLVTPFYSLADVAAAHFSFVPVRLLLRDKYESWRYAPNVTAPVQLLAAELDEIVPRESTDRLRDCFRRTQVSYATVPGAGHNTISASPAYVRLLHDASHLP